MIFITLSVSFTVALITCLLFVFFWRRRLRRDVETQRIIRELRSEISDLITEINGTTDRNIAVLESRIGSLTGLTERAERAVKVLSTEKERSNTAEKVYTELARHRPLNLTVENEAPAGENSEPDAPSAEDLPVRERAIRLHRQGRSIDVIAEELDMSRGEVELIISLHERRRDGR